MPMRLDVLKSSNTNPNSLTISSPTIVLDDSCIAERDFSSSLMGKINDINAMSNLYHIIANEGFENVKLSYLGGISSDKESKGDFVVNKSGNFDFDNKDEIDHVSDSSCMHGKDKPSNSNEPVDPNKSEDPFEIYKILKKKKELDVTKSDEPQFPPCFTPEVVDKNVMEINPDDVVKDNVKEIGSEKNSKSKNSVVNNKEGFSSDHIGSSFASKFKTGGSILEVIDELITVGQTMGYNMDGCMKNIESIIGTWVPSSTKLFIIFVYAPQELSDIKMLWDYFHHLIDSWDGECMILDHALWKVIVNGDSVSRVASASAGTECPIPPKIDEQKLARKNELKAKSTLMLAILDEHLLKFHACKDAKIQKLISQLEIHGEVISQEDANLKLLRSLPTAWNNIALIMRNKSDLDTLSMDDLYNNLKVYEAEINGQLSLSLNYQNVAFVSSENTSSTNEAVNTAHDVSVASSQGQASSSTYVDDVMFSFFTNQSNSPQLDNEDLEQIDTDDLKEIDLKWQVVRLTMRVKRFIKMTGRNLNFNGKEIVGFDKTNVECYNCHRRGHFARECRAPRNQGNRNRDDPRRNAPMDTSTTNALVVQDVIGSSSSSSSDSEYDVQVKDISIKNLKNQLEEALKEKYDLKLKLENFEESSKNLTKLINSQISAKDKTGLGYDSQINESEVVHSVFNSRESDEDDNSVNDRFKTGKGFHAVPPPYTGNYMPSRPDLSFVGLDESVFMFCR
ncbi:ribonuclease H-like domain-containing protein [Tanacetum coccineum]